RRLAYVSTEDSFELRKVGRFFSARRFFSVFGGGPKLKPWTRVALRPVARGVTARRAAPGTGGCRRSLRGGEEGGAAGGRQVHHGFDCRIVRRANLRIQFFSP